MAKNHDLRGNLERAWHNFGVSQEGSLRGQQRPKAALVSVVIPCYNQAHFLGEAIESVLAQSYPHFEIIVVDDGSTDNTSEVAARYPEVRLVSQDNLGLAAARNAGLWRSQGEYMVFLDADDRLLPEALKVGVECLEAHPECAFVFGYCNSIADDASPLPTLHCPRVEGDQYLALLRRCYIWPPAVVMYRHSVFEAVGAFDASVSAAADYDMYLRIARRFPICNHEKVVVEYRVHGTSMNHNFALMLKSTLAVLHSQRKYAKGNKQYEEAIEEGIRASQDYYGGRMARKVQAHTRKGEWKQGIRSLLVLVRLHPRVFARVLRRLAPRTRAG